MSRKVGEVVLSARQIAGLDERLEKCSRERMAERNHENHNEWYASWCAAQEEAAKVRKSPRVRVRAKLERTVKNKRFRPGTIGDRLQNR